ncbi:glycerophosphoryl diester phosphodiesterase membrane domain-containing protein [Novosphingopyxis sp. YJ-S2-01]|uniref:glycerophosphoryl diester phosphodiesterase membrane domain-containing protein n=1 Tax=Novosphingopyxis sp. YJ-S2-01 TaxID=2794021 RepID=UPI0018DDF159|nr:glycerophosphoryl diester phosphodiesterase membrane domain-containing protein [Novosphingopyxis sp. YJ-S2-01]MBH9537044.1 glycerophosphoryl diester phosphodiesterase membrane domain-containing protein [Novosphingopyxis sp. YJ-S2-01]
MAQKLDFSDAWSEALALISAHKEAALAIAGVFLFLPQVALGYFAGQMDTAGIETSDQMMTMYENWFAANGLLLFIGTLVSLIGSIALYVIFLRGQQTIGEALATAVKLFIPFLLLGILTAIAVGIGFILLIIPGIYLAIKFTLGGTVIAAEDVKNPIEAMKRSWQLTKGNSLRIFFFLLIIFIVGIIALAAIGAVIGIPISLLLPAEAALFANNLVSSVTSSIFSVVLAAVYAAIYRQLAGRFDQRELEETF